MKKILLIIILTLCIFQMVVLAIAIDVGSAATNRSSNRSAATWVSKNNPANASGKITSVEIWAASNLSNCEVATFFVVSGDNLSTRDTHTIGSVTAGSKQTFSGLDITVEAGDYIGIYFSAGTIDAEISGGAGLWYVVGDSIPCTNVTFGGTTRDISLYGSGTTTAAEDNAIFYGNEPLRRNKCAYSINGVSLNRQQNI